MGPSLSFVRFFFSRDPKPGMKAVFLCGLEAIQEGMVSRRTTGFLARLLRSCGSSCSYRDRYSGHHQRLRRMYARLEGVPRRCRGRLRYEKGWTRGGEVVCQVLEVGCPQGKPMDERWKGGVQGKEDQNEDSVDIWRQTAMRMAKRIEGMTRDSGDGNASITMPTAPSKSASRSCRRRQLPTRALVRDCVTTSTLN